MGAIPPHKYALGTPAEGQPIPTLSMPPSSCSGLPGLSNVGNNPALNNDNDNPEPGNGGDNPPPLDSDQSCGRCEKE